MVAYYLFIASLVGMAVHVIPYLGMNDPRIHFGPFEISMSVVMPLAVAAFLIWYSKQARCDHSKTKRAPEAPFFSYNDPVL